jgi:hypothetical protein
MPFSKSHISPIFFDLVSDLYLFIAGNQIPTARQSAKPRQTEKARETQARVPILAGNLATFGSSLTNF